MFMDVCPPELLPLIVFACTRVLEAVLLICPVGHLDGTLFVSAPLWEPCWFVSTGRFTGMWILRIFSAISLSNAFIALVASNPIGELIMKLKTLSWLRLPFWYLLQCRFWIVGRGLSFWLIKRKIYSSRYLTSIIQFHKPDKYFDAFRIHLLIDIFVLNPGWQLSEARQAT